jgi:hypothetical protein
MTPIMATDKKSFTLLIIRFTSQSIIKHKTQLYNAIAISIIINKERKITKNHSGHYKY